jgi:putative mRNA 3-end processing factor
LLSIQSQYQGFIVPELKIGLDVSRSIDGDVFISHAHADHSPKNKSMSVYATPATAALLRARGFLGGIIELPFYESVETERARVTFYPAGHILGSAMTYIESDLGNVLYTGDFKTPPSPVSEGFAYPNKVDILITEATFGLPIYKWLPHETLFDQIRDFATNTLNDGETPVFYGYSLGKTQEILNALAPLGLTTQVYDAAYPLCKIYEDFGMDVGSYERFDERTVEGKAVVCPHGKLQIDLARTANVSGWATLNGRSRSSGTYANIALSDHADFFELMNWIEVLQPKNVHITHTPDASVVSYYLSRMGISLC